MTTNTLEAVKEKRFSVTGLSAKNAAKIIADINTEKKYWYTETRPMINPVPNMSCQRPGSAGTSPVIFDNFSKDKFDESYMQFVLDCSKCFPKFTMYVHDSHCMFYPIFGILYRPWFLAKESYILKFTKSNIPDTMYKDFVEYLYSKTNIRKHQHFGLEAIKKLSHYEY